MRINTTIIFKPDDVKTILADYLKQKGYSVDAKTVKFEVGEVGCHGDSYDLISAKCDVTQEI
jgi:hypothetical protein